VPHTPARSGNSSTPTTHFYTHVQNVISLLHSQVGIYIYIFITPPPPLHPTYLAVHSRHSFAAQ
jgi:hypothetical protein